MEPEVEEDVTNDEVWNRLRSDERFEAIVSKQ